MLLVTCNTGWREVRVGVRWFYSCCPDKRKTCWDSVTKGALGSASCAYWADMQLYRTTGSVQQEQESSPLTSNAEHTGAALNRWEHPRDNRQFEEERQERRQDGKNVPVLACAPVGYKLFETNQTLCNVQSAFIFLFQVAGYRRRWQEFGTKGCADVQRSLPLPLPLQQQRERCAVTQQKTLLFNPPARPDQTRRDSGPFKGTGAAGGWTNTGGSASQARPNIVDHVVLQFAGVLHCWASPGFVRVRLSLWGV